MAMREDTGALRFEGVYGGADVEALAGFPVSRMPGQCLLRAEVPATESLAFIHLFVMIEAIVTTLALR